MKQQIRHRLTNAVLFECDVPDSVASVFAMRHALGAALKVDADLTDAVLTYADLMGADITDADLRYAVLTKAVLTGADGKTLPRATPKKAIENLDKIREIILEDQSRLDMGLWHNNESWRDRSCAEEAVCGTTHCLAGWLQVCTTETSLKTIDPHIAGILAAPVAAKMFFRDASETLEWLRNRKYVEESAMRNEVAA